MQRDELVVHGTQRELAAVRRELDRLAQLVNIRHQDPLVEVVIKHLDLPAPPRLQRDRGGRQGERQATRSGTDRAASGARGSLARAAAGGRRRRRQAARGGAGGRRASCASRMARLTWAKSASTLSSALGPSTTLLLAPLTMFTTSTHGPSSSSTFAASSSSFAALAAATDAAVAAAADAAVAAAAAAAPPALGSAGTPVLAVPMLVRVLLLATAEATEAEVSETLPLPPRLPSGTALWPCLACQRKGSCWADFRPLPSCRGQWLHA